MKNSMKKLLAAAVLAMAALSGTAYADGTCVGQADCSGSTTINNTPIGVGIGGGATVGDTTSNSNSTAIGVGVGGAGGTGIGLGGTGVGLGGTGIGGNSTNIITDNTRNTNTANGGAGGQGGAGGSSIAISSGGEGGRGGQGGIGLGGSSIQGQQQGQGQGQKQNSENNNDNSSNAKANAGNGSGNSTVNTTVVGATTVYPRQTQSAHAAGLSVSNGTCMGSTSGAAQGPGFGISIGGTWNDDNCNRRYNAQLLDALGQNTAAVALLCQDVTIREAMEVAGTPCVAKPTKVAVLNVPAKPEVTDKYIRARAGLPPLPEAVEPPVTNPQSD